MIISIVSHLYKIKDFIAIGFATEKEDCWDHKAPPTSGFLQGTGGWLKVAVLLSNLLDHLACLLKAGRENR